MHVDWEYDVPSSVLPLADMPLAMFQLLQQQIPVLVTEVVTVSGGRSVSLPGAFTDVIAAVGGGGPTAYSVSLSKQTYQPDGGELYISDKTNFGFKVQNSGSGYGETVLVAVFWRPPA